MVFLWVYGEFFFFRFLVGLRLVFGGGSTLVWVSSGVCGGQWRVECYGRQTVGHSG